MKRFDSDLFSCRDISANARFGPVCIYLRFGSWKEAVVGDLWFVGDFDLLFSLDAHARVLQFKSRVITIISDSGSNLFSSLRRLLRELNACTKVVTKSGLHWILILMCSFAVLHIKKLLTLITTSYIRSDTTTTFYIHTIQELKLASVERNSTSANINCNFRCTNIKWQSNLV